MGDWILDRKADKLYVEDSTEVTIAQKIALMHGETVIVDGKEMTAADGPFIMIPEDEAENLEPED